MFREMNVELIDHMGEDLDVVNAARVSFHKESNELSSSDIKLTHYLAKHDHWTPFAHCFAKFRVKVPIFVARQWFKHTVGFAYNEVSRRYVSDEPELFKAEVWRGKPEGNIKQGSSSTLEFIDDDTLGLLEQSVWHYNMLIEKGIAPEMARMVLPQATMTEFIVSGSLAAWARFYNLRSDDHAQHEIRWCAEQIGEEMAECFPNSWAALCDNCKEWNFGEEKH